MRQPPSRESWDYAISQRWSAEVRVHKFNAPRCWANDSFGLPCGQQGTGKLGLCETHEREIVPHA